MKSLLLKDVLVLLRQSRLFTLLTVLLALCSGFKPEVLRSIAILYAVLLPLSVLAYDEQMCIRDSLDVGLPAAEAVEKGQRLLRRGEVAGDDDVLLVQVGLSPFLHFIRKSG